MLKRELLSNPQHGIPQHETFAVKSMDVNSNLLRLKLDMVYRDLSMEEARKRFSETTQPTLPPAKETEAIGTKLLAEKPKPKRKVVKALIPKTK